MHSASDTGVYGSMKVKIFDMVLKVKKTCTSTAAVFCDVFSIIVLMKILLSNANQYNHHTVNLELLDMILRINPQLQCLQSDNLDKYGRAFFCTFPLAPQLLELLRCYLVVTDGTVSADNTAHVDTFCGLIISLSDTVEDLSQLHKDDLILNKYFFSYYRGHEEFDIHQENGV